LAGIKSIILFERTIEECGGERGTIPGSEKCVEHRRLEAAGPLPLGS